MDDKQVQWGPLGYVVYKRTYSRSMNKKQTEEFTNTIDRIIGACNSQLDCKFTTEEQADLKDLFFDMKCSVAGRFLWQLGTSTVDKFGLLSLQNCAAVVVNEPVRPFTWAMDALMLGCGVGYNIQREYVYELPKVQRKVKVTRQDTNDADFIVPDSREGWVALLERTLTAYFITGQSFSYSLKCIRNAGVPIKGFGGVSSGPEPLAVGIGQISEVLSKRAGKKVRPIDCLDVMNILGSIVVSGNVRRSAQIAVGDMDDLQFLNAKRWDLGNIPNWRAMSNNSIVCNDFSQLPEQFWQGYEGNGEPYGLINLKLSREIGRVGETQYPDPDVIGYNPCAEQSLANYETCCLAEIFLPNVTSQEELTKIAKYLYRINKKSLALECHHQETQDIVNSNMRMGIGITGYLQATDEQKSWLSDTYKELRKYDVEFSAENNFPRSIKLTTVKPSGTLSLLAGVTPGVHPGYSPYYIRRVRLAANSDLVPVLRSHGYPLEFVKNFDGTEDHSTLVVSFPCSYPEHTVFAKDCTAVQQLEYVKRMQTEWSDNSVSCTVYYRKEELPLIREWLSKHWNNNVKSVSFLLHNEHGFAQAPYEEITKEQYEELAAKVTPITQAQILEEDIDAFEACESGACPIK